nr:EOG090X036X [Triops cancriformis]
MLYFADQPQPVSILPFEEVHRCWHEPRCTELATPRANMGIRDYCPFENIDLCQSENHFGPVDTFQKPLEKPVTSKNYPNRPPMTWSQKRRVLETQSAVRFGRVPKREKAKILAAMQSVNARSAERALSAELADDQQLMNAVIRAHVDTCDFTKDKVEPLLAAAQRHPDYATGPTTLACPLNPTPVPVNGQQQLLQDFSERFSPAIRGVVEFAKRLPGFSLLTQDDQVTLLKAGVFEVLLVRLAAMFDSESNTMLCLNGQLLRRDALHNSANARFLMDSMFDFAERLNNLGLSDAELALFCAVVVVSRDRPGLRGVEMVERMESKLRSVLESMLAQSHPEQPGLYAEVLRKIPDLRTLNILHSEKLQAFKMTEQSNRPAQIATAAAAAAPQPPASPWDSFSRQSWPDEEGARSPLGSVSSTESVYSSEAMSDLPLLAAVAGTARHLTSSAASDHHLHHRLHHHRRVPHDSENGSTSSDGEDGEHPLMIAEDETPQQCPYKSRKLDSPDDSGIESGVERYEKMSTTSRSTTNSFCSSPRSVEDKVKDMEELHHPNHHHQNLQPSSAHARVAPAVDDMPVLKRVLQAPPLFDTNSLMDEAYKPHKKFRALTLQRRETVTECADPSARSVSSPMSSPNPPMTLISALTSSPSHVPSTSSPLLAALSSPTPLTSTHSTLARSLMEGPRISSEQQRRADLIVTNIMRGTPSYPTYPSQSPALGHKSVLTTGPYYHPYARPGSSQSSESSFSGRCYDNVRSPRSPVDRASLKAPTPPMAAELPVGVTDAQPLNLSLKSPSSSPTHDRSTPVSHPQQHYFPLHA